MPKIRKDIDSVTDLEAKKQLLKEIEREDLIDLFKKNYKSNYTPIRQKKVALDQSVAIAITSEEREILMSEIMKIKKTGGRVTLSSVMRNRVLVDVDLMAWREKALKGLEELNGPDWNKRKITKERDDYSKKMDKIPLDDSESRKLVMSRISECNRRLAMLEKPTVKRSYRLRGRVTFNEANIIRWRAARLSLTVADYMRFLIFDYMPFTDDDKTMSVDSRKRFYISILDVAANGWGTMPEVESCPNCVRHIEEIKELKAKLERLKAYSK